MTSSATPRQEPPAPPPPSRFRAVLGLALAGALVAAFPAAPAAQVTVNDQADRLAALKEELEKARQLRDRVIAKRWDDKRLDMEAREKFNAGWDELKNQLEVKNGEADRLHEEIQVILKDAEEAEAQAENAKIQFATLSSLLRDRISEASGQVEKSYPARIPERVSRLNALLKSADTKRDAPAEILADAVAFHASEVALSREISLEKRGFLLADKTPGEGLLLRIGMVASAYRDAKSGRVGILVKDVGSGAVNPWEWRENLPAEITGALAANFARMEKGEAGAVAIPVDILPNQAQSKSYITQEEKSWWEHFTMMLKTGGVFMYPLLVVPFIVIALFLMKLVFLMGRRSGSPAQVEEARKTLRANPETAIALAGKKPRSLVLKVIATVAKARSGDRAGAEKDVQEVLLHEVPRLERHLTTLSVMAAAAPLLGLLGTVSGLISMFQVITEHGVNDPKLLAGGIGEALVATETGLLVAIPTLLGHNWLANRVDRLVADAEFNAMKSLNTLWPLGEKVHGKQAATA
jgi:biopolymer transport protein ExbB